MRRTTERRFGRALCGAVLGVATIAGVGVLDFDLASARSFGYSQINLGLFFGDADSEASAVSSSGQIIGQTFEKGTGFEDAFSWTAASGMVRLPSLGGTETNVVAVNGAGQVVGSASPGGFTQAYSWTASGGAIDLGTLGGTNATSEAVALNASGEVVGDSNYRDPNFGNVTRAFAWTSGGGMVDLGTLGGPSSAALGVNDSGEVVGYSDTASGESHAFVWSAGQGMTDLGTLGGATSLGDAINDAGQVVGQSEIPDGGGAEHVFIWTSGGGLVDLGIPVPQISLASSSTGYFENESGEISGITAPFNPAHPTLPHAFIWTATHGPVDLGSLGGGSSQPLALSDEGEVVGASRTRTGATHAFVWTPAAGMVDLKPGHSGRSFADGIDAAGDVAGDVFPTAASTRVIGTAWLLNDTRPIVTHVTPPFGHSGTRVTIVGGNLAHATTVMFGSTPATSFSSGPEKVVAFAPPGTPGTTVDVTVTNAGGTSQAESSNSFLYTS